VTLEKVGILRINVEAGNASLSRICSPAAVRLAGGGTGKIATVGKPDCYGRASDTFLAFGANPPSLPFICPYSLADHHRLLAAPG
jgi:hypothetical protein